MHSQSLNDNLTDYAGNKLALEIYCDQGSKPISEDQVEQVVLEVAFNFFDNASNGNRSRGGVKKASET